MRLLGLQLFLAFTVVHARNGAPPSSDRPSLNYSFEVAKETRFELATPAGLVVQTTQEV
jgi:hypothetical protein